MLLTIFTAAMTSFTGSNTRLTNIPISMNGIWAALHSGGSPVRRKRPVCTGVRLSTIRDATPRCPMVEAPSYVSSAVDEAGR